MVVRKRALIQLGINSGNGLSRKLLQKAGVFPFPVPLMKAEKYSGYYFLIQLFHVYLLKFICQLIFQPNTDRVYVMGTCNKYYNIMKSTKIQFNVCRNYFSGK